MAESRFVKIRANERIDQLALRVYGDPFKHETLLALNPDINMFYPISDQYVKTDDAQP